MDNTREDFQQKLRSWFQNKGIIDKLVLYLRSQMFIELQNHSKETVGVGSDTVSPKHQAVKLLIADFLLQENLLFSLSVFCSEVPVLMNFKRYTNYISQLASLPENSTKILKQPKPKFTKSDVHDILEALGLRFTRAEIGVIHKMYKSEKFNSLLFCLLYLLPAVLKKNRNVQKVMVKIKKKDKYFKRTIRLEKIKINRMYTLIQNAYSVVLKHKTELNLALQKQDELLKREAELNNKEEYLNSKEKDFEQHCRAKVDEIEKKTAILVEKDHELQMKHKKLLEEHEAFNSEKLQWIEKTGQMYSVRAYETVKLQEYEQKFCTLQNEVFEILKQCRQVQDKRNVEIDKSIITQLIRRREMNEVAEKLYSPKFTQTERRKSPSPNLRVSRRLFPEKEPSSSEFTSSTSKEDSSLTDELVAEAKSKLKQLENESKALNKNFKSLQTILSKNISLSDDSSQSVSPIEKLARKYNMTFSPRFSRPNSEFVVERETKESKKLEEAAPPRDEIQNFAEETTDLNYSFLKSRDSSTKQEVEAVEPSAESKISRDENQNQNITEESNNLNNPFVKSTDSSIKQEGELSAASKNSESSDFWK